MAYSSIEEDLARAGLLKDDKNKSIFSSVDDDLINAGLKDDPNKSKPGFISDVKRGTGQVISSVGSTLRDLGPEETGKSIEEYGNKITRRNPSAINTVDEALSNPFTTIREALGEVTPQVAVSGALGIGGRILGGAIGSLAGPAGTVAGQAIGGAGGAYLGNLVQEYGGIRSEQRESGDNDIARALGTGAAAAGIDTIGGAERVTRSVLGHGASILERDVGKKLLPHIAKQTAIGAAEEAGTEVLQTGLERVGAFKDLTGDDAYNDYGLSAIKGGIGGGIIRGGIAGVAGQKKPEIASEEEGLKSAINEGTPIVYGPPLPPSQQVGPQPAAPNIGEGPPLPPSQQVGPQPAASNIGEGPPLPPSQQVGPPTSQQVADANAQAKQEAEVQKKAEEQAAHEAAMEQTKQIFNAQPNEDGGLDIAGKRIYNMPLAKVFLGELYKTISKYSDVDKTLASAVVKSGAVNITDKSSSKSLIGKIGSFLDTYQLHHVDTIEEAATIVDKQIGRLNGSSALKEGTVLNNFYKNLTGVSAPSFAIIEKQAEEALKPKETKATKQTSKGATNGQQTEQQQVPTRVGDVPVTGGATETGNGNLGLLQSPSLRPIESGSNNGVTNSQQDVGSGESGTRDNASGAVTSTNGDQQKTQRVIHNFDETPLQGEVTNEQPTTESTTPTSDATGTPSTDGQPAANGGTDEVSGSKTAEVISRSNPEFLDKVREAFEQENNTPEGMRWRNETGLDYAHLPPDLKTKWARALATGNITPSFIKNMLGDFDETQDIAAMLADRLVTESNRTIKGALPRLKTLFAYLVTFPKDQQQPKGVLAQWFNVSQNDVTNWRKSAYKLVDADGNIKAGWSETSTKLLRDAIDDIKAKTGIKTDEEFKAALRASKEKIEATMDYKSAEIKELTTQTVLETNSKGEEGETDVGLIESNRKNMSVNEQYNKGEKVTTEGTKIQASINKLEAQLKVIEDNIAKAEENGDNEAYDTLSLTRDDIESDLALKKIELEKIEIEAKKAQKASVSTNLSKKGTEKVLQEKTEDKKESKPEKTTKTKKETKPKNQVAVVKTEKPKKITLKSVKEAIQEAYIQGDITGPQQYDLDLLVKNKGLSASELMVVFQKAKDDTAGVGSAPVKTNSLAGALKAAGIDKYAGDEKNGPVSVLADESNTIEGEAKEISITELALALFDQDVAAGYDPYQPSDWSMGKNRPAKFENNIEWLRSLISESPQLASAVVQGYPVKTIKEVKNKLADNSRTIEGEARVVSMTAEQTVLLTDQTNKLTDGQNKRLEEFYKVKRGTPEFIARIKADVLTFANEGAKAVAGAVRDIIRQIANGVMSVAIIFNPGFVSDPIKFAVPTYETRTEQVVEKAPAEAAKNMSPAAQRAYEVIFPAIKENLATSNKFFIITDKPTATQFIFKPDGSLLFQSKVLVGKSVGDFLKGNNNIDANKITPAGLMTLVMRENTSSTKGYDFNTVFGVEGVDNGQKYFTTLMHSVWLNEKDAAQRQKALSEAGPGNSRYSFGCINTDKDTFGKLLKDHKEQMNGAMLFVVPDNQESVMEFINGKAVFEKDITRQGVTPKTKTVVEKTTPRGAEASKSTQLAGKEERFQFSKTKESTGLVITPSKLKPYNNEQILDVNGYGVSVSLASYDEGKTYALLALKSKEPNKGNGSKFMKDLTNWADKNKITLELTAAADHRTENTPEQKKLEEWYSKNGFSEPKAGDRWQTRSRLPQLSKNKESTGATVDQVKKELREFIGFKQNSKVLKIVQSVSQLPKQLQESIKAQTKDENKVAGFALDSGVAYIIADNINPDNIRAVFMHEVGSHLGLQEMLTVEEFEKVVDKINEWSTNENSLEGKIALKALQRVAEANPPMADRNDELVAYFIEEAIKAGVNPTINYSPTPLGRMISAIMKAFKKALDKLGFNSRGVTAKDIIDMAYGAAHIVIQENSPTPTLADRVQFSTNNNAFKKWFGSSKIVNSDGTPKVMYHGTARDITEFRAKQAGAIFVTSDPKFATNFARTSIDWVWDKEGKVLWDNLSAKEQYEMQVRALKYAEKNGSFSTSGANYTKEYLKERLDANQKYQFRFVHDQLQNYVKNEILSNLSAGENIIPVFVRAEKPFDYGKEEHANAIEKVLTQQEKNSLVKNFDTMGRTWQTDLRYGSWSLIESEAIQAAIKRAGFDAFYVSEDGRKNLAVYSPNQLKSAIGNNGEYSLDNNDIRFSIAQPISAVRAGAQKRIDSLPPAYRGPVHAIFDTIEDIAKKGAIMASFTEDLASVAKKYIPSVVKYVALMKERSAIRTMRERRVDDILTEYQSLNKSVKGIGPGTVNAFLMKSTMDKKWAYQPSWLKDPVTIDPELEKMFNALVAKDKKAGDLIKKVFEHGFTDLTDMKESIQTNISTEYDALIKQAEAEEGNEKEVAELQKKKADELRDFRSLLGIQANLPYAPLKRFGNYVVVGKSEKYLEAEKQNDRALIRKLESDGNEYFVQFADTWAEAKAISRSQEGKYALVEPFEKDTAQRAMYGGKDVNDVFERLRTLADKSLEGGGAKSKKAVDSLLLSLKLSLLSQHSARQAENHRRNIAGAEEDMMRSFATQGRANAHFISSLHNTDKIYDQLRAMKEEADASTEGRGERRRYYNEFIKRHSMGFNYQSNPLMDKALGVTSLWMLLSSPAHFLQNATQPFMMSMPVIAGKHGEGKTFKAMLQAYKEIGSLIRSEGFTEKTYAKLPTDVREAIETLVNSGRIDISLESDLGAWKSDESKNVASIAIEKLRRISQDIESINRVVTAVAAYRLEKESGKTKEEAVAYADQIILDTHGDYSGFNAPRFTRQGLGRLMTQFRKFQLIQISLIAKLGHQAFKAEGKNAEETKAIRAIGKKALAFTLGHTFAAAGVMGMPGFAAIAWIIGKAFGDDDEPDNPEATLRKMIGDDSLADLLLKGVPKLAGMDLSGKLGMGQMLSILPYTELDLTRDGYARAVTAAMGPFIGGLVPKAIDGVGLMTQGNYYKGLEAIAPKGIADALKSVELANKGITQRNGDVVLSTDDIGVLDVMSQALGLPTNTITDKQFIRNAEYQSAKFYKERSTDLKTDYVRAFREGDTETMADIREKWEATQVARVRNGEKRQPISELFKAPQEQVKREKNIKGGIAKSSLASGITER